MLNQTILMGRLTRDPELRRTQSGTAVTSFTLAVERDYSGDGSEKQTDFIDIVAWRSTAEFAAKYFTKGKQVAVSGRLQTRTWSDKDGNKRKTVEVVAEHVYFADGAGSSNGSKPDNQPVATFSQPTGGYQNQMQFAEVDDADLPF